MNNRTRSFLYAAVIAIAVVVIFLGFLSSLANPLSWLLIVVLLMLPIFHTKLFPDNQIKWKDEYSVGITFIDADHKKLIMLLNKFTVAYDHHTSEEFEKSALDELISYTIYHFEREEKMMSDNEYPDFIAHKAKHEEMIAEVNSFVALYNEKGHEALEEVSDYLKAWLINHINGTDKGYSQFMNDKGIN